MSKQVFFAKYEFEGLTFNDVRLKSGRKTATLMPKDVSIVSRFSRRTLLRAPIVSAAMDTVTEAAMAIGMANCGGLGIIHKNLTPQVQADEVATVKFSRNAIVERPIIVRDAKTLQEVQNWQREKKWNFHSFPVLDANDKLVGLITRGTFKYCLDPAKLVRDAMKRNVITAKLGTTVQEAYEIMAQNEISVLPIVDDTMSLKALYAWSDVKDRMTGASETNNLDDRGQLRVGAAVGSPSDAHERQAMLARVELLVAKRVDVIVIDSAHGDSEPVIAIARDIKKGFDVDVVIGNFSEGDSLKHVLDALARDGVTIDGIKVGQGPGSICTTREVAGIGTPQLTAIYECAVAAGDIPVCADGGIKVSGDIPIAIGAGAHSVMIGNMLAGTDETPGELVSYQGRQWKRYRGMGSLEALLESQGSRDRYHETSVDRDKIVPEGVPGLVPHRGPLEKIFNQLTGGLRKGMGYVGADTIEELRAIADFRKMSAAGQQESKPHDIVLTEEPTNYKGGAQ